MMASAYLNTETAIGCVFGTGCNGAYFEKIDAIPKLANDNLNGEEFMAINCEWGAFDNEHAVLPLTSYDIAIDEASPRKGQQAFEIIRLRLVTLLETLNGSISLLRQGCQAVDLLIQAG